MFWKVYKNSLKWPLYDGNWNERIQQFIQIYTLISLSFLRVLTWNTMFDVHKWSLISLRQQLEKALGEVWAFVTSVRVIKIQNYACFALLFKTSKFHASPLNISLMGFFAVHFFEKFASSIRIYPLGANV